MCGERAQIEREMAPFWAVLRKYSAEKREKGGITKSFGVRTVGAWPGSQGTVLRGGSGGPFTPMKERDRPNGSCANLWGICVLLTLLLS